MSSVNVTEAVSGEAGICRLALASLVPTCPNATMSPNRRFLTALSVNGVPNRMPQFKRSAGIPESKTSSPALSTVRKHKLKSQAGIGCVDASQSRTTRP